MSSPRFAVPDAARSRLRATIATIEREMARLPPDEGAGHGPANGLSAWADDGGQGPPHGVLRAAWADLVDQLALGPEPELRECPFCQHVGMRAATRCGHCWKRLTPPPRGDPS